MTIQEKINKFFSQYKVQKYKKGEILVRADDNPSGVFYLIEGQVKMYFISRKGDELIVNVFKPGAFFPMSWALNNTPNTYYFEAMANAAVLKAPREKVIDFLKSEPEILLDLLRRVFKGTGGLLLRMSYLMAGSAYTRLVTEILIQSRRFGKSINGEINLKISEKDLAALTGMTRETVSREMRILKERKIVQFMENNLFIKNFDALENELNGGA